MELFLAWIKFYFVFEHALLATQAEAWHPVSSPEICGVRGKNENNTQTKKN